MQDSKPWELHPGLSEVRLSIVADIIQSVRDDFVSSNDVDRVRWGAGCMIYDLTREEIKDHADQYDWLDVVDPSMSFVFSIGGVPIRFYRGSVDDPTERTLSAHRLEASQMELAFPESTPLKIAHWRFAIDTDIDTSVFKITLVAFDENDSPVCTWDYERITGVVLPFSNSDDQTDEAIELDPAPVKPKGTGKDESDIQSG